MNIALKVMLTIFTMGLALIILIFASIDFGHPESQSPLQLLISGSLFTYTLATLSMSVATFWVHKKWFSGFVKIASVSVFVTIFISIVCLAIFGNDAITGKTIASVMLLLLYTTMAYLLIVTNFKSRVTLNA